MAQTDRVTPSDEAAARRLAREFLFEGDDPLHGMVEPLARMLAAHRIEVLAEHVWAKEHDEEKERAWREARQAVRLHQLTTVLAELRALAVALRDERGDLTGERMVRLIDELDTGSAAK